MKLVLNLTPFQVTMLADLVDQKCEELEEEAEYLPDDDDLHDELQEWYNISKEFEF